jgi:hypothetical protein
MIGTAKHLNNNDEQNCRYKKLSKQQATTWQTSAFQSIANKQTAGIYWYSKVSE